MGIAVGVVAAEEVATTTTTTTTAATSAVVNINDACSNGCKDDDPSYWCGMNKKDADGRVVRCVERTVNGGNCMGACDKKSESYYWCMTNTVKVGGGAKWWDKCSIPGSTTNNEKCLDSCSSRGEDYYWCHTSKEEKDKWNYPTAGGGCERDYRADNIRGEVCQQVQTIKWRVVL